MEVYNNQSLLLTMSLLTTMTIRLSVATIEINCIPMPMIALRFLEILVVKMLFQLAADSLKTELL
jgi:hypothetical protein